MGIPHHLKIIVIYVICNFLIINLLILHLINQIAAIITKLQEENIQPIRQLL